MGMKFSWKKMVASTGVAALLAGVVAPGVSASVQEDEIIEEAVGQENVEHGTYTFTNAEFFETVREMGYDIEEPVNDPEYNPNQVNTIEIGTTNSESAFRSSAILDQTTTTISSSVLNTIKDLGVVAGTAALAFYVPSTSVASAVAQYIGTQAEIQNDLQLTMVHQRTMNGTQWVVTNYQWV